MSDPFIHLHVASGHSLRYGADSPAALVRRAAELGQSALALTDRDGLYGAVRFVRACREVGIAPVLGVDLAVTSDAGTADGVPTAPGGGPSRRTPARGGTWVDPGHPRVLLLARGRRGWASLSRLVSAAHLSGERGRPVATPEQVMAHAEGLELLLGPESEVGRALVRRRPDLAAVIVGRWREAFEGHLWIEVVSHLAADAAMVSSGIDGSGPVGMPLSSPAAAGMLRFAEDHRIPAVLTNAVRHAQRSGAATIDVLDAIRRLVPLDSRHRDRANGEGRLKSGEEMARVAAEVSRLAGDTSRRSADRLLATTADLGRRCLLDPQRDLGIGEIHVPELDVLFRDRFASVDRSRPEQVRAEHRAADRELRGRCEAGLHRRGYGGVDAESRRARRRLAEELRTISELGFAGYFLTVAEVVDLIREMGVRVAARGSGAGSLVNHLVGISGVDPLRHGLLMERFLSPLRRALPDIDIDVESARRTEIYERILQRFGGERCICVSMTETYRVRHAVRDVGAALGMLPGDVDEFAKAFPHIPAREARNALRDLPELRRSTLGRAAAEGRLDHFLSLVESLDGLPRHIALHPCGIVLSDSTLLDRTPVESSWMGFPMTQFDKDDVEEMGLLKLDVLGIRMQSAIAHAVAEVARVVGPDAHGAGADGVIDVDALPLDDPDTFDLIRSTRTLGCFQIESPGQRELIGKFAPEGFGDIIIDISLFRPGPVKSDMVHPFLRARHGWDQAEYLHADLRPVLAETAGVVVFHEQVMQILAIITGCSLAQADEVRRGLGSAEEQDRIRAWFYPAALDRGYPLDVVERVWDVLMGFASFGFCKAHAAAFALPTYQSAWLKAHHPAAFLAGVLTHDPGMYPKRLIADDARNFGVPVRGVDVNRSEELYRVEVMSEAFDGSDGFAIRVPFTEVKGITAAETARLVAGRPYETLADCWYRARPSLPVAERLILIGAFDSLYGIGSDVSARRRSTLTRRDLLLQVADLNRRHPTVSRSRRQITSRAARPADGPGDPVRLAEAQSCAPAAVPSSVELSTQLSLPLGESDVGRATGLPEMGPADRVRTELEVLGMEVSHHVIDFYRSMLSALGVVSSVDLVTCRSRSEILVAGVKVATQTPPVRSGRRVVFLTVDDGSGPADAAVFEDAQDAYAGEVFHHWTLLVRGQVRRTGPRGVSLRATGVWDLRAVHRLWQAEGVEGVRRMLADSPHPDRDAGATGTRPADRLRRRRVLVHPSGYRMNVYADVRPAGEDTTAAPPSRLWHSSPGSSGW